MAKKYSSYLLIPTDFIVNKIEKYVGREYRYVYTLDIYYDFNNAKLLNIGLFDSYEDAYDFGALLLSNDYSDLLDDPTFQLVRSPCVVEEGNENAQPARN